MKKISPSIILSLAVCCLLMISCAKEEINTSSVPTVTLSEEQLATNYLQNSPTTVTFAVLKMNHSTADIQGLVIDNEGNVKRLAMESATFLDFKEEALSNYFTEQMKAKSEVIAELDIVELAANVKNSRKLSLNDNYTMIEDTGNTSQIMLAFKPLSYSSGHDGCGSDNNSEMSYVAKIILSANGAMNYAPTTDKEIALVTWLQNLEETHDN